MTKSFVVRLGSRTTKDLGIFRANKRLAADFLMFNPPETTQQPQPGNYNQNNAGFFQEFTSDLDAFETGHFGTADIPCPICKKQYESHEAIVDHLNSADSCYTAASETLPAPKGLKRAPESNVKGKYHPTSGYHYILPERPPPRNIFQEMQEHDLQPQRTVNPWYPFDGPGEWSLGRFLVENLSQTQIDQFLKLEWFKTRERPSFKSKDELFFFLESLPGRGPKWQCTEFRIKGYESVQPIYLIWRDALEVAKQLFANPVYSKSYREIGEFWTSDDAWSIQVQCLDQLPPGATIVPIIMASDKTPCHTTYGPHHMPGAVWHSCQLPTFLVNSDYQTLLQTRLWHRCVDFITSNLKVAARVGEFMADPSAHWRHCFTPLISHIADLPEQLMISCVTKNSSPITTANQAEVDPWDLYQFNKEAKKLHLSGVHLPFWRNWRFANPATFLTPEILHTLLKFFFDHVLKWIKEVMGHELDVRFRSQHKRIGVRHFGSGVSHVKQMTGREHRDIQRTIVPTLWGAAPPDFIHAVRAIIDFIYLAQNPVHTPTSIRNMTHALNEFHRYKQAIIAAEARRGKGGVKDDFFIPKLELMQSFARIIQHVGSLMQYSADHPFEKTSRQKDFVKQIARILDREEAIRLFELYTLLSSSSTAASRQSGNPLINAIVTEDDEVAATDTDPALSWISRINPEAQKRLHGPRPVRNHFLKGIVSDDARVAFNVTLNPSRKRLAAFDLQTLYHIPDFLAVFYDFIAMRGHADLNAQLNQLLFNVWYKFRIQLHSAFNERSIMPSQVVQADPPSEAFPSGHCDAVLIGQSDGSTRPFVAQVRAVFQPTTKKYSSMEVPAFLNQVFVLVQPFNFVGGDPEPLTGMWRVQRSRNADLSHPRYGERLAVIVPLTDVTHGVELIPIYEGPLNKNVGSNMSMELFDNFFLNNFADKEMYHALAVALDAVETSSEPL
ncbi:hypothetical protein EDD22DRAFT_977460 [Suillus occidentalis]|nr:hypothetical protein EDD22DRAFT_977460 [Suillus occidentalis]